MHCLKRSLVSCSTVAFLVLGFATLEAQLTPPTADLILHLKSDAGVVTDANGRLLRWEDQATGGNPNDATPEPTFGTSEPAFTCAAFPNGEHAVLGFQGDAGLGIDNPLDLSVTELSVYAVVGLSPTGGSIFGNLYHPGFGFGYRCVFSQATVPFFYTSGGTEFTYGNDAAAAIPDAIPGDKHYLSWHASNTALTKQVYVDGVVTTINFTAPDYQGLGYAEDEFGVPIENEVASIGSFRDVGVQHYEGPIAEILVYGSVSTAQREAVEDYLQEKYGFPGQPAATPPALPELPPTSVSCTPSYDLPFAVGPLTVELSWKVCGAYTQQRVLRDGNEVAVLSGAATSYSDTSPLEGLHTYEVEATIAGSPELSQACEANFVTPVAQGRILHLAGDQGVITDGGASGDVLTWEDQSPAGGDNDAQHEVAWGSGSVQQSSSEFGNGFHDVLHFEDPEDLGFPTGAGMSFLEPEALSPPTRSMSIYAVIEVRDGMAGTILSNYSNIINWGYGFSLFLGRANHRRLCFFTSAGTAETIHDFCSPKDDSLEDGWHLITATVDFSNGTKRIYVNGELNSSADPETPPFWDYDQSPTAEECDPPGPRCYVGRSMNFHSTNNQPAIGSNAGFFVGLLGGGYRYHTGGLAELIMYDSVSEEQRLMVEGELTAKYFQSAPGAQVAGDCNQDGVIDLSDVVCLLGHLFQGNPEDLPCGTTAANLGLMDCNQDSGIDLSDAIYKLAFLFQGGPPPVQGQGCVTIVGCPSNTGCP